PERELLLRYTLQSVTSLVDAQGAYVALRSAGADVVHVAATVGQCAEFDGLDITIAGSVTGRVVRTGEALLTDNILNEPEAQRALSPSGPARAAVLVPRPSGDRRVCARSVAGLAGAGAASVLGALYERADGLRAQRDLIARAKLATVGETASGVAHEVNAPLAAIRMEAELLGRASKDPDTSTTAATITREVHRAARIVRSLLRLARRADTTPTRVQMNDLVHDVAE